MALIAPRRFRPKAFLILLAVLPLLVAEPAAARRTRHTVTKHAKPTKPPKPKLVGIQAEIHRELEARPGDATWGPVRQFYRQRSFRPVWVDGQSVLPRAHDLIEVVSRAGDVGLDRRDYPVDELVAYLDQLPGPIAPPSSERLEEDESPRTSLGSAEPAFLRRLAMADLLLTHTFMSYGSHLAVGRIPPGDLFPEWRITQRHVDVGRALGNVVEGTSVQDALASLEPQHEGYRRLQLAYDHYRKIAEQGGWPNVPLGPTLARGMKDKRVQTLRTRLVIGGDLDRKKGKGSSFDENVEQAVKSFEDRHGLEVDGKLDSTDLEVMNEPAEERVREMQLNLERWRWLPSSLGERRIVVNVPEYMLYVYEGDNRVLASKVMVGRSYHSTPIFSDTLTAIMLHPTWSVPTTIAALEILPAVQSDPDYLSKHGIRVFQGPIERGKEVDPSTINWNEVIVEKLPYSFREEPGPTNPLGRIKFLFPNPFDVYMHDTPSAQLFLRKERSFSYGCVRVEKAMELAAYLMRESGWTMETVSSKLDTVETRVLRVPEPIPVHIVYWTAWVGNDSRVNFRDDVYGLDEMHHREWLKLAEGQRSAAVSGKKWILIQEASTQPTNP